jgi:hypothetical protein
MKISATSFARLSLATLAAYAGMAVAAPAFAGEKSDRTIEIDLGDDEELLEKLIAMDAAEIAEVREGFAEARAKIADALDDIEGARVEASKAPDGQLILKIAFSVASSSVSGALGAALNEFRSNLDDAERDLAAADVSAEEKAETQGAIDMIREELSLLEASIDTLVASLKA